MRWYLLLTITLFLLPSNLYLIQTDIAGCGFSISDDTPWSFNLEAPPLGYDMIGGDIEPNTGIYGNLTVTAPSGGLVDLAVMDEENFDLYSSHQPAMGYTILEQVTEGDFTFIYPGTGLWYTLVINQGLDTKYATLMFSQDETPPDFTVNLANGTTVGGQVFINITATDNAFDVEVIKLWIDGVEKPRSYSDTMSYPWFTTDYADGPHNVTITVEDELENRIHLTYNVYVSQTSPLLLPLIVVGGGAVILVVAVLLLRKRPAGA